MAALVLDTTAYAALRADRADVLDALARADSILVPATVLGELEAGFRAGRRYKENRVALESFLEEPFVSVLPVSEATSRRYGAVFASLRRAGTPIPANDVWIAAAALDAGAPLLSSDPHFDRVEGLEVIAFPAGG
jgi:predicted nucleic acid-binding protein